MSTSERKLSEYTVRQTFSDSAKRKAWTKLYSFKYKIDGVPCRTEYDPKTNKIRFTSHDKADELFKLIGKIERTVDDSPFKSDLEVRKFLCKHLQATIKVAEQLERTPASERRYKVWMQSLWI